jgi:hypothetical protein
MNTLDTIGGGHWGKAWFGGGISGGIPGCTPKYRIEDGCAGMVGGVLNWKPGWTLSGGGVPRA